MALKEWCRNEIYYYICLVLYLSLTHSFPCHTFHIALMTMLQPLHNNIYIYIYIYIDDIKKLQF